MAHNKDYLYLLLHCKVITTVPGTQDLRWLSLLPVVNSFHYPSLKRPSRRRDEM
jgi:hypothetical protein